MLSINVLKNKIRDHQNSQIKRRKIYLDNDMKILVLKKKLNRLGVYGYGDTLRRKQKFKDKK